ncbi:protein phosphatase inhibitor 2-like [Rhincodon typus]|uniref:protein phosphatase inhibitor 2-like n=1 Tax=Rhincodon typus TaxID=259920 RepID=UPI0020305D7B|nr:protein phosphatase inhibitor 2-like [Rhincodon typus]
MDRGKPVKGILKKTSSSNLAKGQKFSEEDSQKKSQSWDEMNILSTYKPPGKDYGLMSINEPKTPYRYDIDDEAGSSSNPAFSVEELAARMSNLNKTRKGKKQTAKVKAQDSDEEDIPLVDREKRRQFEMKRKQIYDEGQNIQRARELIAREEVDDHDDSDYSGTHVSEDPKNWQISLIRKIGKCCCLSILPRSQPRELQIASFPRIAA